MKLYKIHLLFLGHYQHNNSVPNSVLLILVFSNVNDHKWVCKYTHLFV